MITFHWFRACFKMETLGVLQASRGRNRSRIDRSIDGIASHHPAEGALRCYQRRLRIWYRDIISLCTTLVSYSSYSSQEPSLPLDISCDRFMTSADLASGLGSWWGLALCRRAVPLTVALSRARFISEVSMENEGRTKGPRGLDEMKL